MFVHRLAEPIDEFDGLTPLPEWFRDATPHAACWAMQALLALADAAPHMCSLRDDLTSGRWAERNRDLLDLDTAELGSRLLIA